MTDRTRMSTGRHRLCATLLAGLGALLLHGLAPAAAQQAPLTPAGDWLAENIRGAAVVDRVQTTLTIADDGAVTGSGGCNQYQGKATIEGAKISFGPLATTRMACAPAVMAQEQTFFAALAVVRAFRIDAATRKLFLLDLTGTPVVRLSGG